jgi:hypothetical protein
MAASIVPPPRRRASPAQNQKEGFALSSRYAPSGRKPVLLRLTGGGAAPGRSREPRGRKKRTRPCLRFFPPCRPSWPPRHYITAAGRTSPTRILGFPSRTA